MVRAVVVRPSGFPRSAKKQAGISLINAGRLHIAQEPAGLKIDRLHRWENGPVCRSFSSNSEGYSPQTIEQPLSLSQLARKDRLNPTGAYGVFNTLLWFGLSFYRTKQEISTPGAFCVVFRRSTGGRPLARAARWRFCVARRERSKYGGLGPLHRRLRLASVVCGRPVPVGSRPFAPPSFRGVVDESP